MRLPSRARVHLRVGLYAMYLNAVARLRWAAQTTTSSRPAVTVLALIAS